MVETWWIWVAFGIVLAIVEVALPGYVFLGLALGATLTGLLIWSGAVGWLTADLVNALLAFAVLSALFWLGLRLLLGRPRRRDEDSGRG